MPFLSQKAPLILDEETRAYLQRVSAARTAPAAHVERAGYLLAYASGETVSAIARRFQTNRVKVNETINRALQVGARAALSDLPRSGRPPRISDEARAWLISLACQKPKDVGYAEELWTTRLLAQHARLHCDAAGHPSLQKLGAGTVSKILSAHALKPHKVSYYLERRDPDFDAKMASVLHVYKEVEVLREKSASGEASSLVAILSYDEKPGIQVLGNTAPDLPPVPGTHPTVQRDHEYIRHGTLSLLCGIDLLSGRIVGRVEERHRSREFVDWLRQVDSTYPDDWKIRLILDNHSAHISKETRAYLATVPNRFEFIFTPTHGSWLNLIEVFFSKLARTLLRQIRADSKAQMKARIEQHLARLNEEPVVFRWTYRLDEITSLP
jgi:transposase